MRIGVLTRDKNSWCSRELINAFNKKGIIPYPFSFKDLVVELKENENFFTKDIDLNKELDSYFDETLKKLPKVIAFNKQDLPDKFSHVSFMEEINYNKYSNIDYDFTIALNGEGILSSFESILRLVFKDLYTSKLIATLS